MDMNNEPVAWISENDLMNICHKHPYVSRDKILDDDIPLYTHPPAQQCTIDVKVKDLTDEEQDACFNRGYKEGARDYANKSPQIKELSDEEIAECFVYAGKDFEYPYHFAKAILKKASEK